MWDVIESLGTSFDDNAFDGKWLILGSFKNAGPSPARLSPLLVIALLIPGDDSLIYLVL